MNTIYYYFISPSSILAPTPQPLKHGPDGIRDKFKHSKVSFIFLIKPWWHLKPTCCPLTDKHSEITSSLCLRVCAQLLSPDQLFCDPMDCSAPGSSVHRIFQARILECVAIFYSRGSYQPRDWTCLSTSVVGWIHQMQNHGYKRSTIYGILTSTITAQVFTIQRLCYCVVSRRYTNVKRSIGNLQAFTQDLPS